MNGKLIQGPGAERGPFCPLLSTLIPVATSPLMIGGQQTQQVTCQLVPAACAKSQCMLFDVANDDCGLLTLIEQVGDISVKLGLVEDWPEAGTEGGGDVGKPEVGDAGQPSSDQ